MGTPTKAISYRRRHMGREQSGLESGSRRTVPVSLGRPPSLHGLPRSVWCAGPAILLLRLTRSRIFHRDRPLSFRRSAASQVLRGRVTSTGRAPTACALRLPVAAQAADAAGQPVDLPTSAPGASIRARFSDRAGFPLRLARGGGAGDVAFRISLQRRHPEVGISRLNSPPVSPPTSNASATSSRRQPHDGGRRGSLLLQRSRLSLYTPGRL